jgi:hypothetical protein
MGWMGVVLTGSGVGLLAFHGRLEKLTLGFRAPLDAVLDVDNWLREHPRGANPRARICARYASLLRYLCTWKNPRDGGGYKAIVIVAHSQGTVITADLLRFLKRELPHAPDASLTPLWERIPIYFFSVGCPLRQLYALHFPDLYGWARPDNPSSPDPWAPRDIAANTDPDPKELLGVRQWVNAFRSGDYIGRYLWRADTCRYQWDTLRERAEPPPENLSEDADGLRREFCLGTGAHTHYLDGTAPAVAAEIDRLIVEACRLP